MTTETKKDDDVVVRWLRNPAVRARVTPPISNATLYRLMESRGFPRPRKMGPNNSLNLWDAAEVDRWIAARLGANSEAAA